MAKKRKMKMEFRYYQMQDGIPILALLGEKWVQNYGRDVDYLHFHNYLEIGFCYSGEGELVLGEEPVRFAGREFTIIPPNFPHTTTSDVGNISKWEYLFIDAEGFLQVAAGTPLRAEKMIQRIYSKALCLKESEYKSLSNKIIKILEIMRASDEFYLEEAKGVLLALLAEVARMNRSSAEENIEEKAAQEQTVNFDQGWFVIQTYSGYENKVKENLLERAQTYNMTDNILRIEIPTETVDKEVNGKRKEVEENLFPGYVLVEMNMTDEAWFVVRNTPNVTGFVGSHGNRSKPTPLFEEEIQEILQGMGKVVREITFDVYVGKRVKIVK